MPGANGLRPPERLTSCSRRVPVSGVPVTMFPRFVFLRLQGREFASLNCYCSFPNPVAVGQNHWGFTEVCDAVLLFLVMEGIICLSLL